MATGAGAEADFVEERAGALGLAEGAVRVDDREPGRRGPRKVHRTNVRDGPAGRFGGLDDRPVKPVPDGVGRGHGDVRKTDGFQSRPVLRERQGTRDATDEAATFGSIGRCQGVVGDHVADPYPPARAQDARHLGEDCRLVRGQIHDTVADDDINGVVTERDRLDPALAERHVRGPCRGRVLAGQIQHVVGHVQAVHEPGRADPGR